MFKKPLDLIKVSLLIIGLLGMAGCGGGGGSSTSSVPGTGISGVAATGSPITASMNGVVTIQDSASPAHTASTSTDAYGNYSFSAAQLAGWTAPFMLEINYKVAGINASLHSVATAADLTGGHATINITPLTDLVIANVAGDIATQVFKNQANYSTKLTPTALAAGVMSLDTQLKSVLTTLGLSPSLDLLRQSFTADGTGVDALLDSLKVIQDPLTNTATIVDRLDGSQIVNSLSASSPAPLPAPTITSVSDLQAITDNFAQFSTEMAQSPSPTDPKLTAFFDSANFMQDGKSLSAFLQNITTNPKILGGSLSFVDITLETVPAGITKVPTGTKAYWVHFTALTAGMPNRRESFIVYKNASTGLWVFLGNQKVAKVRLEALATSVQVYGSNGSTAPVYCTGLWPDIVDQGGLNLAYALVKGPGLPATGLLLFASAIGGNASDFTLAAVGATYKGGSTQPMTSNVSICGLSSLYPLQDTDIAAITGSPMKYSVDLYQSGNLNTPLVSYTVDLAAVPLTHAQLSSGLFTSGMMSNPVVSAATLPLGGTVTVNWSAPAVSGLYANALNLWAGIGSGQPLISLNVKLSGQATSSLVTYPALSGGTYAGVNTSYMDALFRDYWTTYALF